MALFKQKGSKNWRRMQKQKFEDEAHNRDVHASQNIERGTPAEATKPTKQKVMSLFLGFFVSVITYVVFFAGMFGWKYVRFAFDDSNGESSISAFNATDPAIATDWRIWMAAVTAFLLVWGTARIRLMAMWRSSNSMATTSDINTYENDQAIKMPEQVREDHSWFPDVGAHSSVQVSSMLSHAMISRKGLKNVHVTSRYSDDVYDEDGDILHYKGEAKYDDSGVLMQTKKPIIDEHFGQELLSASGIPPNKKKLREPVDARGIKFNTKDETGKRQDIDKLPYDTVPDLINDDWEFPDYEVQRPGGAYMVDTAPVNTMV